MNFGEIIVLGIEDHFDDFLLVPTLARLHQKKNL